MGPPWPPRPPGYLQRHVHLAGLHRGQTPEGGKELGLVALHPALELGGGVGGCWRCFGVASAVRFRRRAGRQGGDPLREDLPAAAAVLVVAAIHRYTAVAHPAAECLEGLVGFTITLDAITSIRDEAKKESTNGKARFHGRLKFQLRYRLAPILGSPRAVTLSKNQDVVVTGAHIPLAGFHQRIRRTAVAVAIGMVLTGDQLLGFLTLLLQTQERARDIEAMG